MTLAAMACHRSRELPDARNRTGAASSDALILATTDSGFGVHQLAEGVYAVVRREPPAVINESNSLFVVGDTSVLVVDAQSSRERTRAVIAALRRLTEKPVRLLVNTHWHDDHVTGNVEWLSAYPGLKIIAHRRSAADLATSGPTLRQAFDEGRARTISYLRGMVDNRTSYFGGAIDAEESASHASAARLMQGYAEDSREFMPVPPTDVIDGRTDIMLGALEVRLLFLGRGHTQGDIVVHVPAAGVMATGDLVMHPVPFVGSTSYPHEFAATLERLRALRPRAIVPGHGPVLYDGAHLSRVIGLMQSMSRITRSAARSGDSLTQVRRHPEMLAWQREFAGESVLRRVLFSYYVLGEGLRVGYEHARAAGRERMRLLRVGQR